MRDEWAEFKVDAGGEEGVVHLLTKLVEQGMSVAHAGPEDVPVAAIRETADTLNAEEKRFHAHCCERIGDFFVRFRRLFANEAEREVNLGSGSPQHARDIFVQCGDGGAHGFGRIEGDKKTGGGGMHDGLMLRARRLMQADDWVWSPSSIRNGRTLRLC